MAGDLSYAWRALRHRNFQLFVVGQSISLIGTWMTRIATSWLVYRLTHSPLMLGMVGFAGQIPIFLLVPFAGVWMDRFNRRHLLIVTQALAMVQALVLGIMTLTGVISIPWILGLSMLQGLVNAFDMPARQSFVIQMVGDRADLSNAIAINSSMVNFARLAGPSVAGLVIAAAGEGWCFTIDGISYLFVITSLAAMTLPSGTERRAGKSTLSDLREGWRYVTGSVPIRTIMLLFALVSLMGMPFVVLMPVFAGKILHGGPHALGFLTGAMGLGALGSAISLAIRRSPVGLLKRLPQAACLFGVTLAGFGLSHVYLLSLLLMLPVGLGMMQCVTVSNTIIQTLVEEDKRGRVMSYYTMAFVGAAPFGSLIAGGMAHLIGAPLTVALNGGLVVMGGLWFGSQMPHLRDKIRPIYRELGILPPEAAE